MNLSSSPKFHVRNHLIIILDTVVWSSYLLVFSEWLFFATKPSFMSLWSLTEHVTVLLLTPLLVIGLGFILLLPVIGLVRLWPHSSFSKLAVVLSTLIPSLILCVLILLLVENFTYAVWEFNIGSFQGIGRYLYTTAIVACVIFMCGVIWRWGGGWSGGGKSYRSYALVLAVILLVSTAIGIGKYAFNQNFSSDKLEGSRGNLPNILILSTDGLNASNMSAYGYGRNTTPFIDSLIPQSLMIENHFSNNAKSTGSIGALFSGKLPTRTRVIYPPDVFRGIDAYQHIPALLKKIGYRNADFSTRHYTDPYDLNMREGFDYANGRSIGKITDAFRLPANFVKTFTNESFFLESSFSRMSVRFQHALSINNMINPYQLVTNKDDANRYFPDEKRIEQLFNFIESSETPFFAHVHLMGTHGPRFSPEIRNFSLGQNQNSRWMKNFYDDAILSYDRTVEDAVNRLKSNNLFDKTLIIITSDHGKHWKANVRIPLILRFPKQQFVGSRRHNVQRVDVSATILDYLGLATPDWVDGDSFLRQEINQDRPIYYADSSKWGAKDKDGWRNVKHYQEPYYSLGGVGMIVAQNWYFLMPSKNKLLFGSIKNHSLHLPKKDLPTTGEAHQQLIEHLIQHNYPAP